ncbi:hypothetical protein [Microcoleus sp. B4-D4]|uniref:hypothetical protein n=1 Tax=Microcoleus sp. B4-D4 TaxID=2818667 RepID=UPI002FD719D2
MKNTKIRDEGRRKKEEGRRKREEGRRKREEGRRKVCPIFPLSPSLPLPFSAAIELLQCPIDLSPPQSMLYSAKIQ